MGDFDLEDLVHVEQTFYDAGYADGYAHGRVHGLIEGRALGREKGFEIGAELGFYEGAARVWAATGRADDRAMHHARRLREMIAGFPRTNPSPDAGVDIGALLRQVRSRYKALCASLGVRASLRAVATEDGAEGELGEERRKRSVWTVEGAPRQAEGLSF